MKKKILFICTHNSARSQMAEALVNALKPEKYEAVSAGTDPLGVNPYAVKAMAELGIDISKNRSKHVREFSGSEFDCVVTLCDRAAEKCPFFPRGIRQIHKTFDDPSRFTGGDGDILSCFRKIRDDLKKWITEEFV